MIGGEERRGRIFRHSEDLIGRDVVRRYRRLHCLRDVKRVNPSERGRGGDGRRARVAV